MVQVYRAEWRMPCAVKKMKGRISKEQMTEFVREVPPLSLLYVACMLARSCACKHGSKGEGSLSLHGSNASLHHAMPPHAGIAPACFALHSLLPSCTYNAASERTATYEGNMPSMASQALRTSEGRVDRVR